MSPNSQIRRRKKYIDPAIQKPLMAGMVAMEVVLVALLSWSMYYQLGATIDESLYRIHSASSDLTWARVAGVGGYLLSAFVIANLIALLIVKGTWDRQEQGARRDFSSIVAQVRALDFTEIPATDPSHDLIRLSTLWRGHERQRFAAVREQVAHLEESLNSADSLAAVRSLQELQSLLA